MPATVNQHHGLPQSRAYRISATWFDAWSVLLSYQRIFVLWHVLPLHVLRWISQCHIRRVSDSIHFMCDAKLTNRTCQIRLKIMEFWHFNRLVLNVHVFAIIGQYYNVLSYGDMSWTIKGRYTIDRQCIYVGGNTFSNNEQCHLFPETYTYHTII